MYNYKFTNSFYNIINSIEDFKNFSVNILWLKKFAY